MKHTILAIILCLAILFTLTACGHKNPVNTSDTEVVSMPAENSGVSTDTGNESTVSNDATTTTATQENTSTTTSQATTTTKPVTTTKKPATTTSKQQTPVTSPQPTSQWDRPAQGNEDLLKQRIIYYINEYRSKEGKPAATNSKAPKMQKYADIRVEDLITDFSHNNEKAQLAKDKAQLGQPITEDESYFDFNTNQVIYTGKKITHYNGVCGEAIGQAHNGSIDYTAKSAADGVYASKGHWAYIGTPTATNITVGVKYGYSKDAHGNAWFIVLATCSDSDLPNNES